MGCAAVCAAKYGIQHSHPAGAPDCPLSRTLSAPLATAGPAAARSARRRAIRLSPHLRPRSVLARSRHLWHSGSLSLRNCQRADSWLGGAERSESLITLITHGSVVQNSLARPPATTHSPVRRCTRAAPWSSPPSSPRSSPRTPWHRSRPAEMPTGGMCSCIQTQSCGHQKQSFENQRPSCDNQRPSCALGGGLALASGGIWRHLEESCALALASGGMSSSGMSIRSMISMPLLTIASYFISDIEMNLSIRVTPSQCRGSGINSWKRIS